MNVTPNAPRKSTDRALTAARQAQNYTVLDTQTPGIFIVIGGSKPYTTDVNARTCSCPDRVRPCKHLVLSSVAAQQQAEEAGRKVAADLAARRAQAVRDQAMWE